MNASYTIRNATDVLRALSGAGRLRERERWPRERLEAYQRRRLSELVEHASTHSPFYRALYGGRIRAIDVRLEQLPTVTKAMMMDHLDDFVTDPRLKRPDLENQLRLVGAADDLFLGEYRVMASSGSSGRKGIYVYDRAAWRAFIGGALRWSRMMGIAPRLPRRRRLAQVAAPDAKHMTFRGAASMSIGLFKPIRLSATRPIDELVAELNRHQPDALTGYPSIVDLLAAEQLGGRLQISPSVISTTSEVRTDQMTARIREAWGVEPFNCLGLTETGITAADCSHHRGLHIFEDRCIFEVVDEQGRPVPPGQPGHKVFVTNLDNRTQPFIRFEVTDLITVDDAPCPCGRTFRRITAIEGRSDDIVELPRDGGGTIKVHPIQIRSALAAAESVAQYQVVQTAGGLDVTVVLTGDAVAQAVVRELERTLGDKLRALGVAPISIVVRAADRIDREEGAGKFKLIKASAAVSSTQPVSSQDTKGAGS